MSIAKQILTYLLLLFILSGCSSWNYYSHLMGGHLKLLKDREPIEDILSNPNTQKEVKDKLSLIMQARSFAETHLALEVGDHYSQFVDINRRYVVWNVFATPELSMTAKRWCYPIVGCLGYRGYYDREKALAHAQTIEEQGYDTYVGGASAYSTLGWFEDPVLSNFLKFSDTRLVGLIFHELSHQRLFVKGDTIFNESFATAVELEGLKLWYAEKNQGDFETYLKRKQTQETFVSLVTDTRTKLSQLYESNLSEQEKRTQKTSILENLQAQYEEKVSLGEMPDYYTNWFSSLNNAKLNTVSFYYQWVPAFRQAFVDQDRDWERFYAWAEELGNQPKSFREETLDALNEAATSEQSPLVTYSDLSLQ